MLKGVVPFAEGMLNWHPFTCDCVGEDLTALPNPMGGNVPRGQCPPVPARGLTTRDDIRGPDLIHGELSVEERRQARPLTRFAHWLEDRAATRHVAPALSA